MNFWRVLTFGEKPLAMAIQLVQLPGFASLWVNTRH